MKLQKGQARERNNSQSDMNTAVDVKIKNLL
jgi:hypothetical protein